MLRSNDLVRRLAAVAFLTLVFSITAAPVAAQVDAGPPSRIDSLYLSLGIGLSQPLQPGDFASDWRLGLALRLGIRYRIDDARSVFVDLAHAGFETSDVFENPEIRQISLLVGLTMTRPRGVVAPYARVGAGLVRQGLRRLTIEDGSFNYAGGFVEFAWATNPGVGAGAGLTALVGLVQPFVEVDYLTTRSNGATMGRVTLRGGFEMSPSQFFERIVRRPREPVVR